MVNTRRVIHRHPKHTYVQHSKASHAQCLKHSTAGFRPPWTRMVTFQRFSPPLKFTARRNMMQLYLKGRRWVMTEKHAKLGHARKQIQCVLLFRRWWGLTPPMTCFHPQLSLQNRQSHPTGEYMSTVFSLWCCCAPFGLSVTRETHEVRYTIASMFSQRAYIVLCCTRSCTECCLLCLSRLSSNFLSWTT